MHWTPEAEDALKKVPFFVRKKVRARIEKEALEDDRQLVTLAEVKLTQKRFLTNMSSEIKGYQLDTCFGSGGCPNRSVRSETLMVLLESLLEKQNLLGFLKKTVKGDLKFHHEFRITLADCPNACSQPQIKDIGIIGAAIPDISNEDCSLCGSCVECCKEVAIKLCQETKSPIIDLSKCLGCGKCAEVCSTGTIKTGKKGFRVLLGGKLGRHPRLAEALNGIYNEEEVVSIVEKCLSLYKTKSINGTRFADIIVKEDLALCFEKNDFGHHSH